MLENKIVRNGTECLVVATTDKMDYIVVYDSDEPELEDRIWEMFLLKDNDYFSCGYEVESKLGDRNLDPYLRSNQLPNMVIINQKIYFLRLLDASGVKGLVEGMKSYEKVKTITHNILDDITRKRFHLS